MLSKYNINIFLSVPGHFGFRKKKECLCPYVRRLRNRNGSNNEFGEKIFLNFLRMVRHLKAKSSHFIAQG
jgi:hypothetical protein